MQDSSCAFDLTTFLRALKLGAVPGDGFGVSIDDIALVESACRILDSDVPSYGWVLALKNGRRLYLEYSPERHGSPEELKIAMLRPEQSGPGREDDAGIHWYRPDHLNAYLDITPPYLH
jgi:hypothetical protein